MKKPNSLRQRLLLAIPTLARDPDQLLVFIDKGRVISTGTPSRSYEYQYTLNLILQNYQGSPDVLMLAIVDWLAINQPELLDNSERRADAIQFEADIIDEERADLSIELPLTERVICRQVDGVWQTETVDEPPPVESDWLAIFERQHAGG
ncbi:P2 phage tail completion protein R (GpR) [Andreprevotia lacus DSM 23236]|jgi:hypothetical protein|uniref:p2 phage tail completion protein R (GpR) n=1 Tax=Andreprevotia lacus DSM 23236 TaxID=1121001 RepID=A0A1W1XJR4_9NEIS|nr:phage tail protein [Andreprevotia lacus]SMC24209.1 P2 phage tail completion protein R (GpR) [Andreprevotia lacus DSM 23236]